MLHNTRWCQPCSAASSKTGLVFAILLLTVLCLQSQAQPSPDSLTSAAIDRTIYRDGEVTRFASVNGDWRIVCDEVKRLRHRFCSLRSLIIGADGAVVASITVSTGQDGRPAGLINMYEVYARGGLVISVPNAETMPAAQTPMTQAPMKTTPKGKSKTAASVPTAETRLTPVKCAQGACTLVWTLKPEQIAALNGGLGLQLIAKPSQDLASTAPLQTAGPAISKLFISGHGFKDAVEVSVRPFE
jgi:hypothetical protein